MDDDDSDRDSINIDLADNDRDSLVDSEQVTSPPPDDLAIEEGYDTDLEIDDDGKTHLYIGCSRAYLLQE